MAYSISYSSNVNDLGKYFVTDINNMIIKFDNSRSLSALECLIKSYLGDYKFDKWYISSYEFETIHDTLLLKLNQMHTFLTTNDEKINILLMSS